MARLSQKNHKNLIDLEGDFNTREEFVSLVCNPSNTAKWLASSKTGPTVPHYPCYTDPCSWMDIMFRKNTWQLTTWAATALSTTYIYYDVVHHIDSDQTITGKILLGMDRVMNGPWYIYSSNVRVWNQDKHFEFQMFDCDLTRFIDFNNPATNI